MYATMATVLRNKKGQGMVEYALILTLVAILLVGALSSLEGGLDGVFRAAAGLFH